MYGNLLQGVSTSGFDLATVLAVPDAHSLPLNCELHGEEVQGN